MRRQSSMQIKQVMCTQVLLPPMRFGVEGMTTQAQERAMQVLRMHVMDSLRRHVEAGQRDFVNEIRTCTMVFVGFPSLKVKANTLFCAAKVASRSFCP